MRYLSVKKIPAAAFDPGQCSGEIKLLLNEWSDIELALGEHNHASEIEIPPALFSKRIEGKMVWSGGDLEAVQRALLETLARHEAQRTSDAIAKLVIWANIHCPEPGLETYMPPAEKLVLSALEDLIRLRV